MDIFLAHQGIYCLGLVFLGLIIGTLSGLFGVGGGFLMTPMLNVLFGIPYNIAVGSSLCQMVGTSATASLRYRKYGQIDYKLAFLFLLSSIGGIELGARALMELKKWGFLIIHQRSISKIYLWITIIYIILLLVVGISMFRESRKARKRPPKGGLVTTRFSRKIQKTKLFPALSLSVSGIESISAWFIVGLGFAVGILTGLLGVGGGFIISPGFIYLFGIPTGIAIGTGLFQIIFIAGYGTLTHLLKGNVDFRIVICILAGSLIGSQLGVMLNRRMRKARIRYYFSWIVFLALGIILFKFLYRIGFLPG